MKSSTKSFDLASVKHSTPCLCFYPVFNYQTIFLMFRKIQRKVKIKLFLFHINGLSTLNKVVDAQLTYMLYTFHSYLFIFVTLSPVTSDFCRFAPLIQFSLKTDRKWGACLSRESLATIDLHPPSNFLSNFMANLVGGCKLIGIKILRAQCHENKK